GRAAVACPTRTRVQHKPFAKSRHLTVSPSREFRLLQDIRFAIRTLVKNPAFTVAAVLCLGVNATIFSCGRATLLRPFPYRNPDELMAIGESNPTRGWHMNSVSYPNFRSW